MTSQIEDRVRQQLGTSIEAKMSIADALLEPIVTAGLHIVNCLLNDNKILVCGNGGSAANGLHFTAAMLQHYDVERPSLPFISLNSDIAAITAIANQNHYEHIFSRQIHAFGQRGDLLLVLTTSGNSSSILQATNAAMERDMNVIALTGKDGGLLAAHLRPEDIEVRVTLEHPARIREIHLFILHCFCDVIEQSLFGQMLG